MISEQLSKYELHSTRVGSRVEWFGLLFYVRQLSGSYLGLELSHPDRRFLVPAFNCRGIVIYRCSFHLLTEHDSRTTQKSLHLPEYLVRCGMFTYVLQGVTY